jgi:hypothetical protein
MKTLINKPRRVRWLLVMCLCIYCCIVSETIAQKRVLPAMSSSNPRNDQKSPVESTETIFMLQRPINCEDFQAYLDVTALRWQKMKGTSLIVIARPGTGERAHGLSKFRLSIIEDYYNRHEVKYVTAEGSRVSGFGRLEFYVGGKLLTVIPIKKNSKAVCYGSTG